METEALPRLSYGKAAVGGLLAGAAVWSGASLAGLANREYSESLSGDLVLAGFGIAAVASVISTALVMRALGMGLGTHRLLLSFGTLSQTLVIGSGFYAWHAFPFVICLIVVAVVIRKLGFLEGWVGILGPILLPLSGGLVMPLDYQVQSLFWRGFSPWVYFTMASVFSLTLAVWGANGMIRAREARLGAA